MFCWFCAKSITGADLKRRVEWRTALPIPPEGWGEVHIWGNVPEAYGTLLKAVGPLIKASHHKCYFASKKREELLAAKEGAEKPVTDWREQEVRDVGDI